MKRIKLWILNKALSHLFCVITEQHFLHIGKGKDGKTLIYKGKNPLSDFEKSEVVAEAHAINRMHTWELLCNSMRYSASEMMYNKSKTVDDLIFSKAVLYTIDVMEKKLRNLSEL